MDSTDHIKPTKKQPKKALASKPPVPSLTEAECWAIRYEYLTSPSTIAQLAVKWDRSASSISRVLSGPDYEQVKSGIEATMREQAKGILVRGSEQAAALWLTAMPVAAARGDHKPMRDLLTATQVIDETASLPRVSIVIGVQGGEVQLSLGTEVQAALGQAGSPYLVPAQAPELGSEVQGPVPALQPVDQPVPATGTKYTVQD